MLCFRLPLILVAKLVFCGPVPGNAGQEGRSDIFGGQVKLLRTKRAWD